MEIIHTTFCEVDRDITNAGAAPSIFKVPGAARRPEAQIFKRSFFPQPDPEPLADANPQPDAQAPPRRRRPRLPRVLVVPRSALWM